MLLSIGLMSGTSMDGIDAALLATDGNRDIQPLAYTSLPYEAPFKILLKAAEYSVNKYRGNYAQANQFFPLTLSEYLNCELNISEAHFVALHHTFLERAGLSMSTNLEAIVRHLTKLHVEIIKNLLHANNYAPRQIDVIGFHGQTLFHQPSLRMTIQVGHAQYLADELGITVVHHFREHDIEAGGQGAPFAPVYHRALAIRDKKIPLAFVNCGGIANITIVQSENEDDLIGFDTGPGNALIDRFIRKWSNGEQHMDTNGQYGLKGKVDKQILAALYEKAIIKDGQNYFQQSSPKSLDSYDMKLISELFASHVKFEDACRTLEVFTADTIVQSLNLLSRDTSQLPREWILAGGGWRNPVIFREFKERLQKIIPNGLKIYTTDEIGWKNSQALEAELFAYLAVRSLQNQPISFPGTTRVPYPLTGGHAYMPRSGGNKKVQKLLLANQLILPIK